MERTFLRAAPGEVRVLIRIGAGRSYPHHVHATPDEVFVVEGEYADPDGAGGRVFGPGSYRYYPPGTEHPASFPSGCPIPVWNAGPTKPVGQ